MHSIMLVSVAKHVDAAERALVGGLDALAKVSAFGVKHFGPAAAETFIPSPALAQCRFEWNLTSSTIMASAVSHQILREPMFDVEPMH
ncbi:hypothetical protein [Caballeronia mineralivorans]|uniref:hypothetical protein n=1 Tax=Caballeronia mineralivorans TaxID=2010198 RepID=UPI002AFE2CD5|nr:hypothetical protein [Caballeronia mineralivorans]